MSNYQNFSVFDEIKRLIVIAAHPDDLESMCGGTIARLVAQGVAVYSVNCTLGDIGAQDATLSRPALAALRIAETKTAAALLGLRATYYLEHHDGDLEANLTLRAEIARLYRLIGADTLFTFDPYWTGQIHPDHFAAGQAALDAFMPAKMPLYHPEQLATTGADLGKLQRIFLFGTERTPEIYVDVGAVYHQKIAATLAHHSQFPAGEADIEWMKSRDSAAGKVINVQYAEPFKVVGVW